jgi:hypothetical protein
MTRLRAPPAAYRGRVTTGTVIVLADVVPVPGPAAALAARMCAAISALQPTPPLRIVANGELALLLPAIALSQRSLHRGVTEYVLIDPVLPTVTDAWPDAPVTIVTDDEWVATQARLRGWDLVDRDDLDG